MGCEDCKNYEHMTTEVVQMKAKHYAGELHADCQTIACAHCVLGPVIAACPVHVFWAAME